MANIKYKLSPKEKHGRCEVLVRFYDSKRFDMRGHTGLFVSPAVWDVQANNIRFSSRFNTPENMQARSARDQLDALEKHIFDAFYDAHGEVGRRWLQDTIDTFNGRKTKTDRLLLADIVQPYVSESGMAESTARQYGVLERHLRKFGETEYVLYADSFDEEAWHDFEEFLRNDSVNEKRKNSTKKGRIHKLLEGDNQQEESFDERCQNTINSKMRRLRAAVNFGIKKGFCKQIEMHVKQDHYGTPIYLTIEEREKLYAAELPEDVAVQRDIFIFQCHVGCRVSDLYSLTLDNITDDGFLQYIQHKVRKINAKTIRVPLTDTAMDIVIKYLKNGTGMLFPFIAQQNYNYAIKDACELAGLDRMVAIQDANNDTQFVPLYSVASSHMARRTFAGNMFKATKSERLVSSMTGHSKNSKELARYTDVDDEMKKDAISTIK